MNDLEIDAIASGMFLYLKEQSPNPLDAIAILGIVLLKVYESGADKTKMTLESFANDFHQSLVETGKLKYMTGPKALQ